MTDEKVYLDQEVLDEIIKSIQQTKYGEVVIIIHDSKVVQIEQKQKKRFKTATAHAEAENNPC